MFKPCWHLERPARRRCGVVVAPLAPASRCARARPALSSGSRRDPAHPLVKPPRSWRLSWGLRLVDARLQSCETEAA